MCPNRIFLCLALAALAAFCTQILVAQDYDIVIRNARVVDGTGNPWFRADVALRDGRIAAIGRALAGTREREIDAKGQILAPGFIDAHTHIESNVFDHPEADSFLFDGVTTAITGNCGGSALLLGEFFGRLEERGIGMNVASLIGHNTVRRAVLGEDDVQPDAAQLERMRELVASAMKEGAVGLSTGLIYLPGLFAKTPEVVALAAEAARHGGTYATHMRNERTKKILEAMDEAIEIGRRAGIPVEISHLKVDEGYDGLEQLVLAKLDEARRQGLDVAADQYPYPASSTTLATMLPAWAIAGGDEAMRERLAAPDTRKRIAGEIRASREEKGYTDLSYVAIASHRPEPSLNGKRVPEITRLQNRAPGLEGDIETVLELLAKPGRTSVVYHSWSEPGVDAILRYPAVAVASDGGIQTAGETVPHPRSYGTNARVLGRYVRERNLLSLEEAIRKMTSLPARTFNLRDRGLVALGYAADLVLFDEMRVLDKATYEAPHQLSEGFSWVLVNGVPVIEEGKRNATLPGKALRGPGTER